MTLNFSIPTPDRCVDCPFGYVDKLERYGKWIYKCKIDPTLDMTAQEGLSVRHPNCPGKD